MPHVLHFSRKVGGGRDVFTLFFLLPPPSSSCHVSGENVMGVRRDPERERKLAQETPGQAVAQAKDILYVRFIGRKKWWQ